MPGTVAARAVLWLALPLFSLLALRAPAAPTQLELVRDDTAECRLGAPGGGIACDCHLLPVDARVALGLPQSLNSASALDLERVPGFGPMRARAIVAERERSGVFRSLEALSARVPGIGAKTIDRIRAHLYAVGPDPACGPRVGGVGPARSFLESARREIWKPPSRDGG